VLAVACGSCHGFQYCIPVTGKWVLMTIIGFRGV
jgi:hypothetical protein